MPSGRVSPKTLSCRRHPLSTSLLYHALGLKGYEYQKTEYVNGTISCHVKKQESYQDRTNCSSRGIVRAGRAERMWYSLPNCFPANVTLSRMSPSSTGASHTSRWR